MEPTFLWKNYSKERMIKLVTVKHVLKDGKKLDNIKGHIVTASDGQNIYSLIENINKTIKTSDKVISTYGS